MALQNQTAFASAIPTATLSSALGGPINLTTLHVVASNDHPSYGSDYYWEPSTYNDAPPSLSYTVQQAMEFGYFVPDYSSRSGEVDYPLRLAADGCRQPDSSYNCSIACVNPKEIFTFTPTMANCMAYGLIVDALISGNVSDSFKQTAIKYGISANRTMAVQVASTIMGCFGQCKSLGSCGYIGGSYISSYNLPSYANVTLYFEVKDMCLGVIAPVMTDIAGIGVRILVRSHEWHKLTISVRYISHTGSKAALRSRLSVY